MYSNNAQLEMASQIKQSEMGIWVTPDKVNLFKNLEGSYPYNLGAEELQLNVNIIEAHEDERDGSKLPIT